MNKTILIALIFVSCNNAIEFDSTKWKSDYNGRYLKRCKMINSLIKSGLIQDKKLHQIEDLLGIPNYTDTLDKMNFSLIYNIQESYGWDIDPQYMVDLNITIDKLENRVKKIELIQSVDRRSWIEKIFTE